MFHNYFSGCILDIKLMSETQLYLANVKPLLELISNITAENYVIMKLIFVLTLNFNFVQTF